MTRLRILNSEFDAVTMEQTIDWARDFIAGGRRGYICTVNVAILMMMRSSAMLQRFVDGAALVVADGQPLVWASRTRTPQLPERVTGVDLVDALCGLASEQGYGVYFLGAHADVVAATAAQLQAKHPALKLAGFADGYFGPDEAPVRADAIAASGAQLLFLGMGVPKQEQFVDEMLERTGVNLAIPVGGSFEIFAGTKQRAPEVLQRVGLEWLYRLSQEPGRLWKRYLLTNTQFLYHLGVEAAARRVGAVGGTDGDNRDGR